MRTIDADALIEDLEYDVELDARTLDDVNFIGRDREIVQFEKDCKQNAIDLLRNAPTIEPERKRGKWTLDFAHNTAKCSKCGRYFKDAFDLDNWDNYCRHCGADMRGQ